MAEDENELRGKHHIHNSPHRTNPSRSKTGRLKSPSRHDPRAGRDWVGGTGPEVDSDDDTRVGSAINMTKQRDKPSISDANRCQFVENHFTS